MHGEDIYKSVEEKGANFLYLVVKNHVFVDGNKRIAATLFIYFLNYYDILFKNGIEILNTVHQRIQSNLSFIYSVPFPLPGMTEMRHIGFRYRIGR